MSGLFVAVAMTAGQDGFRDASSTQGNGVQCHWIPRIVSHLESIDRTICSVSRKRGPIVLAILLAEASGLLQRPDYQALRLLSGVAPLTKQSGRKRQVVMRYACHDRLRNALYHWARTAMQKDPLCRAHYHRLRADGHSHGRALRGIADRLLRIACAMLTNRSLYDPHHHAKQALAA